MPKSNRYPSNRGKLDLAGDPLFQRFHPRRLPLQDVARFPGGRNERERHPIHIRVLRLEHAVVIDRIAHPPQPASHHLLAQELRPERPHPQDVRHRIGVPPLGQHRNAHHAAHLLAQLPLLANRVHHLAQQVFIGQLVRVPPREPSPVLVLELLDLPRRDLLEIGAHRPARFQLLAIDQNRVRPRQPPTLSVVIPEERQLSRLNPNFLAELLLPPADPVEHQLGHIRVVTHHDEHRRRFARPRPAPTARTLPCNARRAKPAPPPADWATTDRPSTPRSCAPSSAGRP